MQLQPKNDLETYIELKHFPVQLNTEYFSHLPDYVLYKFFKKHINVYVPFEKNTTIAEITSYFIWSPMDPTRYIKEILLEYYDNQKHHDDCKSYFIK